MSTAPRLTFTEMSGNAKLKKYKNGRVFSLPAGHACPAAEKCRASCDRLTGKLTDGPRAEWRCFSASVEAYSKPLRECVWRNLEAVKSLQASAKRLADALDDALPATTEIVRMHGTGGDFLNKTYLQAWIVLARRRPGCIFYGYTKRADLLTNIKRSELPRNFRLSVSYGGKYDDLLPKLRQRRYATVSVVFTEEEAAARGLPLDHDDALAIAATRSFALLIHGTQRKNSPAAAALKALRDAGVKTGYSHD